MLLAGSFWAEAFGAGVVWATRVGAAAGSVVGAATALWRRLPALRNPSLAQFD
jgi:hypothetical protein